MGDFLNEEIMFKHVFIDQNLHPTLNRSLSIAHSFSSICCIYIYLQMSVLRSWGLLRVESHFELSEFFSALEVSVGSTRDHFEMPVVVI